MRLIWLVLLTAGLAVASGGAPEPLRVHFISGSEEYRSEPSLREFAAHLEKMGVRCTASWGRDKGDTLPDLEPLRQADLMIVFARRLTLPAEQMAVIRAHWQAGKPVMGLRTASHAWGGKDSPDNAVFDREVLGNHYSGHHGDQPVRVTAAPAQAAHPVLRGVGPFVSRKLYKAKELAPTTAVLQFGDNGLGREPVTLVNEYKGGRTFYTSLGVPEDFVNADFRRMLVNAVFWTTRRAPPAQL